LGISPEYRDNRGAAAKRFEEMLKNDTPFFFDVEFFEEVVSYYFQTNKINKALGATKKGLEQHPFSTELKYEQANALYALGEYGQAITILEGVLNVQPGEMDSSLLLADVKIAQQEYQEAIDLLISIEPLVFEDKDRLFLSLGRAYYGIGDVEKALDYYQQARVLNPKNDEILIELASSFGSKEDIEKGIKALESILDENPFDTHTWYNLGILHDKNHTYEEAIDAFDYALALSKNFSSAHYNKGLSLMSLDRHLEALESFHQTLRHEKGSDLDLLINIAGSYLRIEDYQSAITYYKKIIVQQPNNHIALSGIGLCFYELEKWNEALHYTSKALEFAPTNIIYLFTKADTEYLIGHYTSAIEVYKKITDLEPLYIDAWINLSIVYADMYEYDTAAEVLQEALIHNSQDGELLYRVAANLILAGNYKEAFLYLENALILDFENHTVLFEAFPELETQKALMKIIDQYKN